MTDPVVLGQGVGFGGTALGLLALALPGRARFLRLSALSMACLAASLFCLSARDGAVMAIAGAFCCGVSSTLTFDRPHPLRRWILPGLVAIGVTLFAVQSPREASAVEWLPLVAFYLGRVSDAMRSDAGVRWMLLPVSMSWAVYCLWVDAWGGVAINAANFSCNLYWLARSRSASPMSSGGGR